MKRYLILLVLLCACNSRKPVFMEYAPKVQNVQFPRHVVAGQPLTVSLEVFTDGGCDSFTRIDVERTPGALNLKPIGHTPDYKASQARGIQVACTTQPDQWRAISYSDSGQAPRRNPFQVRVNGKLFGEVMTE